MIYISYCNDWWHTYNPLCEIIFKLSVCSFKIKIWLKLQCCSLWVFCGKLASASVSGPATPCTQPKERERSSVRVKVEDAFLILNILFLMCSHCTSVIWVQRNRAKQMFLCLYYIFLNVFFLFILVPCLCLCFWFSVVWLWILAAVGWDAGRSKDVWI